MTINASSNRSIHTPDIQRVDPHATTPKPTAQGRLTDNLLATVPRASTEMVSAAFRTIFAQTTPDEVEHRWDEVTDQLEALFPKAAA